MEKKAFEDDGLLPLDTQTTKNSRQRRSRRKHATQFPYTVGSRLAHSRSRYRISEGAITTALKLTEDYFLQLFEDTIPMMQHRGGHMISEKDILAVIAARNRNKQ